MNEIEKLNIEKENKNLHIESLKTEIDSFTAQESNFNRLNLKEFHSFEEAMQKIKLLEINSYNQDSNFLLISKEIVY